MAKEKQTHGLQKNIAKAAAVRNMCQTEGFKVVQDILDNKLKLISQKIVNIDTSNEEVLKLRQKAQVWVELQKLLKEIMLTGEISARNLSSMDLQVPSAKEG